MKLETAMMEYPMAFAWGMLTGALVSMVAMLVMFLLPLCQ